VSRNSVNRGCVAKKLRSNASRLAQSGGLGKTPCVKAKIRTGIPIVRSKTSSTTIDEVIAE
jgi:hypothetical protein